MLHLLRLNQQGADQGVEASAAADGAGDHLLTKHHHPGRDCTEGTLEHCANDVVAAGLQQGAQHRRSVAAVRDVVVIRIRTTVERRTFKSGARGFVVCWFGLVCAGITCIWDAVAVVV